MSVFPLCLFLFLWESPECSEKLPAQRTKSPVSLPDLLQLHPRDLTLCILWLYMKFLRREDLYFHINIFILGKIKKCQYILNQLPAALKK